MYDTPQRKEFMKLYASENYNEKFTLANLYVIRFVDKQLLLEQIAQVYILYNNNEKGELQAIYLLFLLAILLSPSKIEALHDIFTQNHNNNKNMNKREMRIGTCYVAFMTLYLHWLLCDGFSITSLIWFFNQVTTFSTFC